MGIDRTFKPQYIRERNVLTVLTSDDMYHEEWISEHITILWSSEVASVPGTRKAVGFKIYGINNLLERAEEQSIERAEVDSMFNEWRKNKGEL